MERPAIGTKWRLSEHIGHGGECTVIGLGMDGTIKDQVLVRFEGWTNGHDASGQCTPQNFIGSAPPRNSTEHWWVFERNFYPANPQIPSEYYEITF